ncbi:MAG: helix-turn-helix transcriptional regulator [Treponema sp.]|nr:helix-turn-helix transcriptional regulator [Treponema sp.]
MKKACFYDKYTAEMKEKITESLTPREQEIFDMLIAGVSPKEIAFKLNISYDTVLAHQKNMYRKLGVHTINELLTKYPKENGTAPEHSAENTPVVFKSPVFLISAGITVISFLFLFILLIFLPFKTNATQGFPASFTRWQTWEDNFGSYISVTPQIDFIQDQYVTTYTIAGCLYPNNFSYTGTIVEPDASTLEAMKKASSFSFSVLGDGNSYEALITTTDTRVEGGLSHYMKKFTTKKDEIITVHIKYNEMSQSPYFGNRVPFNRENIECFQIQAHTTGDFNIKIWNIRIHR